MGAKSILFEQQYPFKPSEINFGIYKHKSSTFIKNSLKWFDLLPIVDGRPLCDLCGTPFDADEKEKYFEDVKIEWALMHQNHEKSYGYSCFV